ncbi:MAG: hypothetical protein LBJ59_11355 [Zoogloeaceae bacterium]|nr:hypothetical protein [Zoogloeaceae bacterium]
MVNAIRQKLTGKKRGARAIHALWLSGGRLSAAVRLVSCLAFSLAFFLVPAAPALAAANENTCCNDASGRLVCGDIMPPRCNGRELKVYSQQGFLIRIVPPRMSEEEKKRAAEEAERERKEQERIRDQARKDNALRQTYADVADLERVWARSEAPVKVAIQNAQSLIDAAQKRKKALEDEAADSGKLAPETANQMRNEEIAIKAQSELLAIKKNELAQIRARFTEDRDRYILLTTPGAVATDKVAAPR